MEFELTAAQRDLFDDTVRQTREQPFPSDRPTRLFVLPAFDGSKLDAAVDLALAMQALGYACPDPRSALAVSCHLFGGVLPLSRWGSSGQQKTYLPRLTAGDWYAARTLPGALEARSQGAGFLLSGTAELAAAGVKPDFVLAFAQLPESADGSTRIFALPLAEMSGISWEASSLPLARADRLRMENARVPDDMLLGKNSTSDALLAELLPRERLALQATRLGLLQQLLESALGAAGKHTRRLKLKGIPPHRYQMLGHKLADFRIRFDAAELLLRRAAWHLDHRGAAAADVALAGLAIESSLLPAAFEVVKLQHDYDFDPDHAWSDRLAAAVDYGRYLCDAAQMRGAVNASLKEGGA